MQNCDLCQEVISKSPIIESEEGNEKLFCCEGCQKVYHLARDEGLLPLISMPLEKKGVRQSIREATAISAARTVYLQIDGMWCYSCGLVLERVWQRMKGVISADVNYATGRARIKFLADMISEQGIITQAKKLGYEARPTIESKERERDKRAEDTLLRLIGAAAFSMWIMWISVFKLYPAYSGGQEGTFEVVRLQYLAGVLATPVMFYSGMPFITGALRSLRSRVANMDTLVALGTLTAYTYSVVLMFAGKGQVYFDSAAMIITIILLGRYLEIRAKGRALRTTKSLLALQDRYANVLVDSHQVKSIPIEELETGSLVLAKAGERFAADGVITEGESSVNESMLTGESLPVSKIPGEVVMAGTVNLESTLMVRVTEVGSETVLGHIVRAVEEAQDSKPPIQRLADRVASIFVPSILLMALATVTGWRLLGFGWDRSLVQGVAVLVVACPCALGLATPLAITVAVGNASRKGILIRSPEVLERIGKLDRVVFDKTGTLTKGAIKVKRVLALDAKEEEILSYAAALENFSEHPIAKAIVQEAEARNITLPKVTNIEIKAGRGLVGRQNDGSGGNQDILVGQGRLMREADIDSSHALRVMKEVGQGGEMAAFVAWQGRVKGIITLADEARNEASQVIEELKDLGLGVSMITGDSRTTANSIAQALKVDHVLAQVLPENKARAIAVLQKNGKKVAMVGDGINDAPALSQADLGIAVSGGTDIAMETSQVTLMRPNLLLLTDVVRLSRKSLAIIRENLGWAFFYNLVAVPAAITGLLSPILAAVAMAASSLMVVINSLRLSSIRRQS